MSERDEIEMLLPWYATGKLEAGDRAKVEAYLTIHPDMQSQLDMIADDMNATIELNEAAGSLPAGALNNLLENLDAQFGPEKKTSDKGWLATQFARLATAFEVPAVRYAGIAAAVVIAVQAATIGSLTIGTKDPAGYQSASSKSPAGYQTASGPSENAEDKGPHLLVKFAPDAKAAEITALMEEIDGTIVSGPRAQGFYEIKLNKENISEAEIDLVVKNLGKRKNLIGFASVSE
jgi:anti-sigma factor RsiW